MVGGRFDAGMLFYSPQIWLSDNTDAQSRLRIQVCTLLQAFVYSAVKLLLHEHCVFISHMQCVYFILLYTYVYVSPLCWL